ncbi:MAG: nascent polypeptide-associated complex protein [Candidatus Altiarchaeota archaeon]|nr:nascent polypeptide-associated complex protein [Candidatus Altiarchaeota archaeon]
MFPGNMNPKQMQTILKRMGIRVEEVEAKRVVIEGVDKNIVIENPQVMITKMPNQDIFQVMGKVVEEDTEVKIEISDDDVNMVAEQAGVSKDKAKKALEENKGDIAAAIIKLKG